MIPSLAQLRRAVTTNPERVVKKTTDYSVTQVLEGLGAAMPLGPQSLDLQTGRTGLVIVDAVIGFTRSGALSDPDSMVPMVGEIDRLTRRLLDDLGDKLSIFVFRDHHGPDQLEPPYPPHCQEGSGEEELDPELRWLQAHPAVTLQDKDCINGIVGALVQDTEQPVEDRDGQPIVVFSYRNHFVEWVQREQLDRLLVVGDCTDICVLDFVVTTLSARNHGMFGAERGEMPIGVLPRACSTYHLSDPEALGLPLLARHDRDITHHAALYFMQSRGALIVDEVLTA